MRNDRLPVVTFSVPPRLSAASSGWCVRLWPCRNCRRSPNLRRWLCLLNGGFRQRMQRQFPAGGYPGELEHHRGGAVPDHDFPFFAECFQYGRSTLYGFSAFCWKTGTASPQANTRASNSSSRPLRWAITSSATSAMPELLLISFEFATANTLQGIPFS